MQPPAASATRLSETLSPEAQLLFLTAGGAANDDALRAVASRIDWPRLALIAERENAATVVTRRLVQARVTLPAAAEPLRRLAMVAEFQQAHLELRLQETLRALRAAAIDTVLLKGAALGHTVYARFADRPMADVDLLVRPGQAMAARAVVLDAGWKASVLRAPEEAYELRHHHLPPFDDALGVGVGLELHTELFPVWHPFLLSADDVRARAREVAVGGMGAIVPDVHHMLLHASIHFVWSHVMATSGWRTFRDVEMLVRSGTMAWERFVDEAHAARAATCCYWTLRLARRLARVELPAGVLEALRPALPEVMLAALERHYAFQLLPAETLCPSERLGTLLWEAGIQPHRNGHGSIRPWDHHSDFTPRIANGGPRRGVEAWARYAGGVLRG